MTYDEIKKVLVGELRQVKEKNTRHELFNKFTDKVFNPLTREGRDWYNKMHKEFKREGVI